MAAKDPDAIERTTPGTDVRLRLSPSLAFDSMEEPPAFVRAGEPVGANPETITLPVAVCNIGPDVAYNIELAAQVEGDGSQLKAGDKAAKSLQLLAVTKKTENAEDGCSANADPRFAALPSSINVHLNPGAARMVTIPVEHIAGCTVKLTGCFSDSITDVRHRFEETFACPSLSLDTPIKIEDNPYLFTSAIGDREWRLVLGRDQALNDLRKLASIEGRRGFIVVRGLRRTGKTTLLRHFCDQVFAQTFPALRECEQDAGITTDDPSPIKALPVMINVLNWRVEWDAARERGEQWDARTLLWKTAQAIKSEAERQQVPLRGFVLAAEGVGPGEFREYVKEMRKQLDGNLLLVFDEADSLAHFKKPVAARQADDFQQFEEFLSCLKEMVVCGELLVVLVHEFASPFWNTIWEGGQYGVALPVRTYLLSKEDTLRLAAMAGVTYTPLAKEYLWRVTGGYPSLVQLICYHVVRRVFDISATKCAATKQHATDETVAHQYRAVSAGDLKTVMAHILQSKDLTPYYDHFGYDFCVDDYRPYLRYLRLGFSLEEKRLLVTLVVHGDIDPHTGWISGLYIDPTTGRWRAQTTLQERLDIEWAAERALEEPGYSGSERRNLEPQGRRPEAARLKLTEAIEALRTKQIIDYADEDIRAGALRLRVGFLYLYLKE